MRLLLKHSSSYDYPTPAALGPHVVRLRPADHAKATIETYALQVEPASTLHWHRDPTGNRVARVTFAEGVRASRFGVDVELAVDLKPINPFDFFLDDRVRESPFAYPPELAHDLAPFLQAGPPPGERVGRFFADPPRSGGTVDLVVALCQAVKQRVRYVIREETGIYTPEETLAHERGSCRDFAVLLIALLRSRGFAARFASGYLIQLADEGMIPDEPRGVGRDVVDLHAWAEVYLPGGGWVGLDATSGLLCGEGHIPLACAANPLLAAPIEGTSDVAASAFTFSMQIARLGHEPRPTKPYEVDVVSALEAAGDHADALLRDAGVRLTIGGEPTFNSRTEADLPEWNNDALGPTKWRRGLVLAEELRARLLPGAALVHAQGKHYPGESLPRWALVVCGDGSTVWSSGGGLRAGASVADARAFAAELAKRLGAADAPMPAFEDPWRALQDEAALPVDVDPLRAELGDPEVRTRLARMLDRGLATEVGFALPLARRADGSWATETWPFRRGHLFLVPGDSPMGLRLPLASLAPGELVVPFEAPLAVPDPRVDREGEAQRKVVTKVGASAPDRVRTTLCVEPRDGSLFVFLPPVEHAGDFFALVRAVDEVRLALGIDVTLEGYPPPPSPEVQRFAVTPDPGVLEVNVPPTSSLRDYRALSQTVFDAALLAGLHSEKYLLDGRQAGSGGGHHLTLGGPTPLESPFVVRPDLLASLLTFLQHHPSLSYLFTGLFVGPTSQAPRADEARLDTLHELEIALARAFDPGPNPPPYLADMLFRHLLADVAGNTHRTEVCIDKLFSPYGASGRQGLVELRAFEMPPHPDMAFAQMLLARSLVAAFAREPYRGPLVRWGQRLHDQFLLPEWLWRDFEDVLSALGSRGVELPVEGYRPFLELRCPTLGTLHAGDVTLTARAALEPWHVLGEEPSGGGVSRYVDSSMERVEVKVTGFVPERHALLVNGHAVPLRRARAAGELVAGIRFRAWAPPHSLQPHIGIHHPLRFDVVDTWGKRSLGAAGVHVWHPEGQGFDAPPLTRFEAAARRGQRFTLEGPAAWPAIAKPSALDPAAPYTLDLRLLPVDRPFPQETKG